MDLVQFVDTRRKRYVALTLEEFEKGLERELKRAFGGNIPPGVRDALETHKAKVRKRFLTFGEDFTDILGAALGDVEINDVAIQLRDRLATT